MKLTANCAASRKLKNKAADGISAVRRLHYR